VFLLNDFIPGAIDRNLFFPIIVILFGVVTLVKGTNLFQKKKSGSQHVMFETTDDLSSDEFVETSTYFGGTKKNVVSKTFKGGNFVTAFGGTEVNLTKAEVEHPIEIKSNTAFGELKLIVPSHWQVRSEVTCMFGGVDDSRSTASELGQDDRKIVTLTGNCLFGEVKVISY
jgi:predicted membrane protein